ncbi:MAG: hypothetical protein QNJ31_02000 [Candidatus Caenarcaniphilales bacterium]|nr:hypothetical protein [Candidatus Caenarcaniphilales bacterium]
MAIHLRNLLTYNPFVNYLSQRIEERMLVNESSEILNELNISERFGEHSAYNLKFYKFKEWVNYNGKGIIRKDFTKAQIDEIIQDTNSQIRRLKSQQGVLMSLQKYLESKEDIKIASLLYEKTSNHIESANKFIDSLKLKYRSVLEEHEKKQKKLLTTINTKIRSWKYVKNRFQEGKLKHLVSSTPSEMNHILNYAVLGQYNEDGTLFPQTELALKRFFGIKEQDSIGTLQQEHFELLNKEDRLIAVIDYAIDYYEYIKKKNQKDFSLEMSFHPIEIKLGSKGVSEIA